MVLFVVLFLLFGGESDLAAALMEDVIFGRPGSARTLYLASAERLKGRMREVALVRAAFCLEKTGRQKEALAEYRRLLSQLKEPDIIAVLKEAEKRLAEVLEGPRALLDTAREHLAALKNALNRDPLGVLDAIVDLPEAKTAVAIRAYLLGCRLYEKGEYAAAIRVLRQAWPLKFSAEMMERARFVLSGRGTPKPPTKTPEQQVEEYLAGRLKGVAALPQRRRFEALYRLMWLGMLSGREKFCDEVAALIEPPAKRLLRGEFGSWRSVMEEARRLAARLKLSFLLPEQAKKKTKVGPLCVRLYVFGEGEPQGAAFERQGVYRVGVAALAKVERHTPLMTAETEKEQFKLTLTTRRELLHKGMHLLRVEVAGKQGGMADVEVRLFWRFDGRVLREVVRHSWKPIPGVAELFGGWEVKGGRLFLVFSR